MFDIDQREYTSIIAKRKSNKAQQQVWSILNFIE
jgi:hypothetical protein